MMPDLGEHAVPVLLAYGGSITLLGGLLIGSVLQARRVQKRLQDIEARREQS